jgi:hypothetical protein
LTEDNLASLVGEQSDDEDLDQEPVNKKPKTTFSFSNMDMDASMSTLDVYVNPVESNYVIVYGDPLS